MSTTTTQALRKLLAAAGGLFCLGPVFATVAGDRASVFDVTAVQVAIVVPDVGVSNVVRNVVTQVRVSVVDVAEHVSAEVA